MMDILSGGLLGSLFGGLFRLAPEVLKWMDKKDERAHELEMFKNQCQLEAQRGSQKLDEIGAQHAADVDSGVLNAFNTAIAQQAEMANAAGGWAASLSASVRPVITYWVIGVWSFLQFWFAYTAWSTGTPAIEVFKMAMSPDLSALVAGTINFWFLDRALLKRGL